MPKKSDRLLTLVFVVLSTASFAVNLSGHNLSIGISVLLEGMNGAAVYAGIAGAVFSISAGVTRLFGGELIDSTSRIKVAVVGSAILFIGCLLPILVQGTFPVLLSRVLQGAGFSAATTAMSTMAADVLPFARLGEGIGYFNLSGALAMAIGPAMGLALAYSSIYLFSFSGILALASLALFALCNYEKDPLRLPPTSAYRQRFEEGLLTQVECRQRGIFVRSALPASVVMLIFAPASAFSTYFAGLYGTQLEMPHAGMYYTLAAIAMILVRLAGRSFMDVVDPRVVFTCSNAFGVMAFVCLLLSGDFPFLYYAAGACIGVMLGIGFPLVFSVAVKATAPERWGAANALVSLAYDIGMAVGAVAWGVVRDWFGFRAVLICAGAMCLAAIMVAWRAFPGLANSPSRYESDVSKKGEES